MTIWTSYFEHKQEQLLALATANEELRITRQRIEDLKRKILLEKQRISKATRQYRKYGIKVPCHNKLNNLINRTAINKETFCKPNIFPKLTNNYKITQINYFLQDNEAIKTNSGHRVVITTLNKQKQTNCLETFIQTSKKNIILINKGITTIEISSPNTLSATHVDLRNNKLSTIPQCILQMPNLKKLYISGNCMNIDSGTLVYGVSSFEIIN